MRWITNICYSDFIKSHYNRSGYIFLQPPKATKSHSAEELEKMGFGTFGAVYKLSEIDMTGRKGGAAT